MTYTHEINYVIDTRYGKLTQRFRTTACAVDGHVESLKRKADISDVKVTPVTTK